MDLLLELLPQPPLLLPSRLVPLSLLLRLFLQLLQEAGEVAQLSLVLLVVPPALLGCLADMLVLLLHLRLQLRLFPRGLVQHGPQLPLVGLAGG